MIWMCLHASWWACCDSSSVLPEGRASLNRATCYLPARVRARGPGWCGGGCTWGRQDQVIRYARRIQQTLLWCVNLGCKT